MIHYFRCIIFKTQQNRVLHTKIGSIQLDQGIAFKLNRTDKAEAVANLSLPIRQAIRVLIILISFFVGTYISNNLDK